MSSTRLYRFHGRHRPQQRSDLHPSAAAPEDVGDGVTAVMRLYDPIDSYGGEWGVSAKEFIGALDELPAGVEEIRLHLNTPGGEVFEAVTILNALRRYDARIVAVVDGIAASAGSFLAAGADETVMAANTRLMIHDAWGLAVGNSRDLRQTADVLDALSDDIAAIYAAKAGGNVGEWRDIMRDDAWFSAEQAVAIGLADRVEGESAVNNHFDLSIFDHDEELTPA